MVYVRHSLSNFGHTNIIKYDKRPFGSVEEHDEALIKNWNSCVSPSDIVYHLGDFSLYKLPKPQEIKKVEAILARLNGQKHHIYGNHDRDAVNKAHGWASQSYYKELKVDIGEQRKKKIVLCHYPFMTWNGAHHGSWHLHGHCHGNLEESRTTRIDVGVPCWDYFPVDLGAITVIMKSFRDYIPVDQHRDRRA